MDDVDENKNESVVLISNIPLHKVIIDSELHHVPTLISVASTRNNLRSLALAIATGTPILLQGPTGCGKTALVEHLAEITGRKHAKKFIKVQLGDQTDSKLLLGTYSCTEVPGEFNWQPGCLTQAVKNGSWLLLEDIDYAPMDVLSILVPLLESKTLPGIGGPIKAANGFHLFATQRLSYSGLKVHQTSFNVTEKLWTKLHVEPLSPSELEEVINGKWPTLKPIIKRILEVYFMFSSGQHQASIESLNEEFESDENVGKFLFHDGRLISTRDLLKWCERISTHIDLSSAASCIKVFQDALDCFCCSVSKPHLYVPMAEAIAARFNITKAKAEFYCKSYKPDFTPTSSVIFVGRGSLPRKDKDAIVIKSAILDNFSFTRPALNLLEKVAVGISHKEPILLVGETGTGKTSTVQYLAKQTGNKLIVINMNQQSDTTDLLGGFKPIDLKYIVTPIRDEFEEIFCACYTREENSKFLRHITVCLNRQRWPDMFKLMLHCANKYNGRKRTSNKLRNKWKIFCEKVNHVQLQLHRSSNALAFSFIEGSLVKAIREGHWLLLDEINLASPETLECLSGLLESNIGSVLLQEKGDTEPVPRHKNFHLFACMNPATDVGKKDLPPGLRNRFTEFFVHELEDKNDLLILISDYLKGLSLNAPQLMEIVQFYLDVRQKAKTKLLDGTGQKPHYSLRTLCRALSYAATNSHGSVPRSLYESFCLSFLTQLDTQSHELVNKMIAKQIIGRSNIKTVVKQLLPKPEEGNYMCVESYWIKQGDLEPKETENYILTSTVRKNLHNLARIIAAKKHPVMLQGETSVGKTSLISYIAKLTGNRCVRINNHEYTDLQEYVGSYASDSTGKLTFKVGVLVDAMKQGYWIILDELNLAPSEVLEALNRVLDDNRELYITETQETVSAHPNFMLFATQNPAGQYGGRKILSRAFRNRFIELHFNEIPPKELENILHLRCSVSPTHCTKLVAVMLELQARRKGSSIFAGKQGFITLRDLFRWGERYKQAIKPKTDLYDWDQHLADEGYILLSGRSRRSEDDAIICQVLYKHLRRHVNSDRLYNLNENTSPVTKFLLEEILTSKTPGFEHVVWTTSMRRLAILVGKTIQFKEPALLVGETGCGKTTICQMFAAIANKLCFSLNCHMHSESADFLGGLRPVRHLESTDVEVKLFEWVNGPLVKAMITGSYFLADEISLAEDSVLERLNSVLESEQTLLLAEKGACDDNVEIVIADPGFHFMATMNPGGDYGKKELSPALRNRFTEIWCPPEQNEADLLQIIKHNFLVDASWGAAIWGVDNMQTKLGNGILSFISMFSKHSIGQKYKMSIRDILSWIHFINIAIKSSQPCVPIAYIHGAFLVFLDSIGSSSIGFVSDVDKIKAKQCCLAFLVDQMKHICVATNSGIFASEFYKDKVEIHSSETKFGIDPFYITKGPNKNDSLNGIFTLSSPSSYLNTQRILRALQLDKPILLEGSPGVGKTSLVTALAKASGHELIRINLSEQTDISDLFGADLPVEGGLYGQFAWREGPLLKAIKAGNWVVFDEMNLASQSVLEGLNACLDYRKEIFIPELGSTFYIGSKPKGHETRIFACQNPLNEGGARKGLPRSFLNRFTQVFIEPLSTQDLNIITKAMFPGLSDEALIKMISFNEQINKEVVIEKRWGQRGAPWEFNLRDIFRWAELIITNRTSQAEISMHVNLVYRDRFRSNNDRIMFDELFCKIFGANVDMPSKISQVFINETLLQIGGSCLPRLDSQKFIGNDLISPITQYLLLHQQLSTLESIMTCLQRQWMAILVGHKSSGKTTLVKLLAQLTGNDLQILTLNSATDTMDLLGGFERSEMNRSLEYLEKQLMSIITHIKLARKSNHEICLTAMLEDFKNKIQINANKITTTAEMSAWNERITQARNLLANLRELDGIDCYLNEMNRMEEKFRDADRQIQMLKDSPIAGGQFEWVDSVLVQAVKYGHWLLLDNVNFCSPSVLDRLNGLLEPNGVLTINERGIVDGEIVTIKPHSNFRLILAMDPKIGEISRSMRNRGVEIYVNGEDEKQFSNLDTHRLLNSIGLFNLPLQKLLLEIHLEIREKFSFSEKPNCLDLFRVAFLTVQQISFGVDIKIALGHSCTDTYINNQRNKAKKKELLGIINHRLFDSSSSSLSKDLAENLVPSVADFVADYSKAVVDNQMVILKCLCYNVTGKESKKNLTTFFFDPVGNPEDFIYFAIKIFIQHASPKDLELRKLKLDDFFRQLQSDDTINSRVWKKFGTFCNKIMQDEYVSRFLSSKLIKIDDIPMDLRWFMQVRRTFLLENVVIEQNGIDIDHLCNSFYLWLNLHILNDKLKNLNEKTSAKVNGNKKMKKANRLLLDQGFGQVIQDLNNFLKMLIESLATHFADVFIYTDDEMKNIETGLLWLQRLFTFINVDFPTFDSTRTSTQLSLHWMWLNEEFLGKIGSSFRLSKKLNTIWNKIDQRLVITTHSSHARCEYFRRSLGTILPFKTLEQARAFQKLNKLNDKLILYSPYDSREFQNENRQILEKVVAIMNSGNVKIALQDAYVKIFNCDLRCVIREICSLETIFNENFPLRSSKDVYNVQLWPVTDHFSILNEMAFINQLFITPDGVNADAIEAFAVQLLQTNALPSHLAAYFMLSCALKEGQPLIHHVQRILFEFYNRFEHSTATRKPDLLLQFLNHGKFDTENSSIHTQIKSSNAVTWALQSLAAAHLLLTNCNQPINDDEVSSFSIGLQLGSCQEKCEQLSTLNFIWWRHAPLLSSRSFDAKANDCKLLLHVVRRAVTTLVSQTDANIDLPANTIENLIEHLKNHSEKDITCLFNALQVSISNIDDGKQEIDHEDMKNIGKSWLLIGIIQAKILSSVGLVDIVEKQTILSKYAEKELIDNTRELQVHDMMCKVETGFSLDDCFPSFRHPHVNKMLGMVIDLENQLSTLKKDVAARPELSQFQSLRREFDHFTSSMLSYTRINELMKNLVFDASTNAPLAIINQHKTLRDSIVKFITMMKETYPMYCDIWGALVLALYQIIHGLDLLIQTFLREFYGYNSGKLANTLRGFASFPWINCDIKSSIQLVEEILIPNLRHEGKVLKQNCANENILNKLSLFFDKMELAKFVNSLLQSCLHEVYNFVVTNKELNADSTSVLHGLLKEFAVHWQHQEDERRKQENEKEMLYQYRTRTHCEEADESKQDEIERKRLFPNYESEFSDLKTEPTLGETIDDEIPLETESCDIGSLNANVIFTICDIHDKIVTNFSQSRWFKGMKSQTLKEDYVIPFLSRYKVALHLIQHSAYVIDASMDSELLGGHLIASSVLQEAMVHKSAQMLISSKEAPYDIYHDSNTAEVAQCRLFLEKFDFRILGLLDEWNEHPTLLQIQAIIKRILSFSVNSSLMKYVTGLELLLSKSQEWESNAHKGVSLMNHLEIITEQVISWRKLELKCWSNCLDTVAHKQKVNATKYWLHVYVLIETYLTASENEKESLNLKEIVQSLEQLLEKSTLGEFSSRLKIVLSFHCHLLQLKHCKKQNELLNIFWNIYQYYLQFEPSVTQKIASLRKPIEKDVKNFVKIARWNDINFWAVKESVAKSHQTLHRHMKQLEKVLKEPVRLAMIDFANNSDHSENSKFITSPKTFIVPLALKNNLIVSNNDDASGGFVLNKKNTLTLFLNMRKMSKKIIKTSPHLEQISDLDEFTTDLINVAHELQNLEVDQSLTKEKQISEAKSINLRKRKALSDLFKALTELGLSYRRGLMLWKENNATEFVLLPPIDVQVSSQAVTKHEFQTEINEILSNVWNGCTKYLYRSVARLALLHTASENPHRELSVGNLDRLFGFPSHLLYLAQKQHRELSSMDEKLEKMRISLQHIFGMITDDSYIEKIDILSNVKDFTTTAIQCLEQFNLLLKSCPATNTNDFEPEINLPYEIPHGFLLTKESNTWTNAVELVNNCLSELKELRDLILTNKETDNYIERLGKFRSDLQQLFILFSQPKEEKRNTFDRSLEFVRENLDSLLNGLNCSNRLSEKIMSQQEMKSFKNSAEKLITKILISIQDISKIDFSNDDGSTKNDFYLRDSLLKNLKLKIDALNVKAILKLMMEITQNVAEKSLNPAVIKILKDIYPILLQYHCLVQFLFAEVISVQRGICKLNSVLLGIFVELVHKGFCVPVQYENDVSAGAEGTEFKEITGGGIGEGDGIKDVSDRLESEDQLEDAFQEGKEQEKEDPNKKPDVKEEENAIDMSEDFDGKMHDLDLDDGDDESEESEDEEELDKQMGDLGDDNDADKLDEKMWGSDGEDDEDEKEEKELENGPGAGKSESRLVAKDDNKNKESNDNDEKELEGDVADENDENDEIHPFDDRPCDDDNKKMEELKGDDTGEIEAEPMEMPDDLKLDANEEDSEADDEDEESKDDGDKSDKNENRIDDEPEEQEGNGDDEEKNGEIEELLDIDEPMEDSIEENVNEEVEGKNKTGEEDSQDKDESGEKPSEEDSERKNKFSDLKTTKNDKTQAADDAAKTASADKTEDARASENAHDSESKLDNLEELDSEKNAHGLMESEMENGNRGKVRPDPEVTLDGNEKSKQYHRKTTNEKRTLGDVETETHKRLKTLDTTNTDDENTINPEQVETAEKSNQLYEHVENASSNDLQTKDSATLEQAKNQILPDEKNADNKEPLEDDDVVLMSEDDEEKPLGEIKQKFESKTSKSRKGDAQINDEDNIPGDEVIVNESDEIIRTNIVERGPSSKFYTNLAIINDKMEFELDVEQMRSEMEEHLAQYEQIKSSDTSEALNIWHQFETMTLPLAQELCEQLRLILEPSLAAKLKGDYRTGKRLNMRKIIPYIASQYRKDKIWLRRTQPNKRQYQVMIAMDDSSSMADNHVKELAFESLAVISKALTLLEAGQLSIASFGENYALLHPFNKTFSDISGAETLKMFSFQQKKTLMAKMLNCATDVMVSSRLSTVNSNACVDTAQLLVIISDGRGIFSEGPDNVKAAIRRANEAHLFVIFIVLDLATNQDSIFDIKVPIFKDGLVPEIRNYMDDFPFAFYIVLQELSALPVVLSDALRQWFELVTSIE